MWSAIGNWLLKVDPTLALMTITTLGTWLWHQVSGSTRTQANNVINAVIDNLLLKLIAEIPDPQSSVPFEQYIKNATAWMEATVWGELSKRGVPKNATTIGFVHEAIARATAKLGERVLERRALQQQQAGAA